MRDLDKCRQPCSNNSHGFVCDLGEEVDKCDATDSAVHSCAGVGESNITSGNVLAQKDGIA